MLQWFKRLLAQKHEHIFGGQAMFDYAPCPGGSHTSFYVFMCRCGAYQLFPQSNYELTTEEFQTVDFPKWLSEHNLKGLVV